MINQIKLFFEQHLSLPASENNNEKKLRLAAAALFMEMMAMDDQIKIEEQQQITLLIQQNFSITPTEAAALMELGEQQRKNATDYFEFTSLINKTYTLEQKIQLVEALWKIAFVDKVLDIQEEYLVKKIGGLLHVPDAEIIMAKIRVSENA